MLAGPTPPFLSRQLRYVRPSLHAGSMQTLSFGSILPLALVLFAIVSAVLGTFKLTG